MHNKNLKRKGRHLKIKKKITGSIKRPRISVFRSNRYIYAQLIDDETGKTLIAATDSASKNKNKLERAKEAGLELAKLALKKNIKEAVFDRSGYRYHGRVKAFAQAAREGGLIF